MGDVSDLNRMASETSKADETFSNYQSAIASLESLFSTPLAIATGQKFLRCKLDANSTALVLVSRVTAVVAVTDLEVLPVPHMPDFVLGIYNWRGEILWLLDLARQVGLSSLLEQVDGRTSFMAMIAEVNGQCFGLAVPQIFDIEEHDIEQLHPFSAGLFPPKLLPFVKGYLSDDRSTVLNIAAIINDPRLSTHSLTLTSFT